MIWLAGGVLLFLFVYLLGAVLRPEGFLFRGGSQTRAGLRPAAKTKGIDHQCGCSRP
jgi:hypothetical protein